MRPVIPLWILLLLTAACHPTSPDPEAEGARMLAEARALLQQKQYDAARDTIESMRRTWPKAFQARTAGIVVMDSIELCEAQDSLVFLDERLHKEQEVFARLQQEESGSRTQAYYDQKNRVFRLQQHVDEMCVKVKFYLRKIDIDSKELH